MAYKACAKPLKSALGKADGSIFDRRQTPRNDSKVISFVPLLPFNLTRKARNKKLARAARNKGKTVYL
jgi:hypothetical protein